MSSAHQGSSTKPAFESEYVSFEHDKSIPPPRDFEEAYDVFEERNRPSTLVSKKSVTVTSSWQNPFSLDESRCERNKEC